MSDSSYCRVDVITPAGQLVHIAGTGNPYDPTPGPALNSDVKEPAGLTVDSSGNVYVTLPTKNRIVKLTPGAASNSAPVLSPASPKINTTQNTAGSVALSASDADGDALTWSIATAPGKGTASIHAGSTSASRSISYTPNSGATGSDSFGVKVTDSHGASSTVTVQVTIAAPAVLGVPKVTATGGTRVGEVRSAKTSYDTDSSVKLAFQWQRAGKGTWVNIAGATKRSFKLPASVMKVNVRVAVTATRGSVHKVGYSAPLLILPGQHHATGVAIVGTPAVGKTLSVKITMPKPAPGFKVIYLWTVAGTKIRGTSATFVVPANARGKLVFVDVQLTAPGYHNQELRSPSKKIS